MSGANTSAQVAVLVSVPLSEHRKALLRAQKPGEKGSGPREHQPEPVPMDVKATNIFYRSGTEIALILVRVFRSHVATLKQMSSLMPKIFRMSFNTQ